MKKNIKVFTTALATLLFCSITLAQGPVVNVDKNRHPNIAEAQRLIAEANRYIVTAQKDNRYDLKGNASKARQLLVQASEELKAAAETANAASAGKKR